MPWKEKTMINERTEFALKSLQAGVNFTELCAEYGISRRTGYKPQSYVFNLNSPKSLLKLRVLSSK